MTTLLTGNVLFVNTREGADAAVPDLQLNFTPAIPAPLAPVLPDFGGPVSIFLPILVQPFSIGEVGLNSADPLAPPRINPNYLSQEADYKVFLKALELIRAIAATDAYAELGGEELAPGPGDPGGLHPLAGVDALAPGRHLQDRPGRHGRGRSAIAGLRRRGTACGRCLGHAHGDQRQHRRRLFHDRREGCRYDFEWSIGIGIGIGDWDWGTACNDPNPQSPIPGRQSPTQGGT